MKVGDELVRELKSLRQEILNLKQVKRASTNSRYFIYKVEGDAQYFSWEITYADGDQPIVSEVFSYQQTALSSPVGNKQYIFSFAQASAELTVLSTREILDVVGVDSI